MCSKHVEAWNKLIAKQKFCSSSWFITEINTLRCTVSKTSKDVNLLKWACFYSDTTNNSAGNVTQCVHVHLALFDNCFSVYNNQSALQTRAQGKWQFFSMNVIVVRILIDVTLIKFNISLTDTKFRRKFILVSWGDRKALFTCSRLQIETQCSTITFANF